MRAPLFRTGTVCAPREGAVSHGSLVLRLGLLLPVVLGGSHVELLMAGGAGRGRRWRTVQIPGAYVILFILVPRSASSDKNNANGSKGELTLACFNC